MKKLLPGLLACAMLTAPALAADPAPPPAPDMAIVQMTPIEIQATVAALANAGQACDQQVKIYCQVLGYRDALVVKLQAALQKAPAAPVPAPAPTK